MALINCPECGQSISDNAKQCPHCGYPLQISKGDGSQPTNNGTNLNNTADNLTQKYSTIFISVIGILSYAIISVMACNLLGSRSVIDDVIWCSIICGVISLVIAKSNFDRLLYSLIIMLIACICEGNYAELSYGTAFIVFATHIGIIITASYKRNHQAQFGNWNIYITQSLDESLPLTQWQTSLWYILKISAIICILLNVDAVYPYNCHSFFKMLYSYTGKFVSIIIELPLMLIWLALFLPIKNNIYKIICIILWCGFVGYEYLFILGRIVHQNMPYLIFQGIHIAFWTVLALYYKKRYTFIPFILFIAVDIACLFPPEGGSLYKLCFYIINIIGFVIIMLTPKKVWGQCFQ